MRALTYGMTTKASGRAGIHTDRIAIILSGPCSGEERPLLTGCLCSCRDVMQQDL